MPISNISQTLSGLKVGSSLKVGNTFITKIGDGRFTLNNGTPFSQARGWDLNRTTAYVNRTYTQNTPVQTFASRVYDPTSPATTPVTPPSNASTTPIAPSQTAYPYSAPSAIESRRELTGGTKPTNAVNATNTQTTSTAPLTASSSPTSAPPSRPPYGYTENAFNGTSDSTTAGRYGRPGAGTPTNNTAGSVPGTSRPQNGNVTFTTNNGTNIEVIGASQDGQRITVRGANNHVQQGVLGRDGAYHFADGSVIRQGSNGTPSFELSPNSRLAGQSNGNTGANGNTFNIDDDVMPVKDTKGNIIGYDVLQADGTMKRFDNTPSGRQAVLNNDAHQHAVENFDNLLGQDGFSVPTPGGNTNNLFWKTPDGKYQFNDYNTGTTRTFNTAEEAVAFQRQIESGSAGSTQQQTSSQPIKGGDGKTYIQKDGKFVEVGQDGKPTGVVVDTIPDKTTIGQRIKSDPMALLGLVGGGFTLFGLGMALGGDGEGSKWAHLIGIIPSYISFIQGVEKILEWGLPGSAFLAGGILLAGFLISKLNDKPKGNAADPTQGDAPPAGAAVTPPGEAGKDAEGGNPATQTVPQPWYKYLGENAFSIASTAALVGLGLQLGLGGPAHKYISIPANELISYRNGLEGAITDGRKLPTIDTGVLGKVFIQSSQNNGVTPDKVVYVYQETPASGKTPAQYAANMMSLNFTGNVVSPDMPNISYLPIYFRDENGAIRTTPAGNAALAQVRATAIASASGQTTSSGAQGATLLGGAATHTHE